MTGGQETGKGGDARAQVVSAQAASAQRHVAASPAAVQTAPAKTPDGAVVGRRSKPVYVPTRGEETANTVSHAVMALLTLCALPYVAVRAYALDPRPVLAACSESIFVISIFLMFLGSTLYHSMTPASRHKEVFHILDLSLIHI